MRGAVHPEIPKSFAYSTAAALVIASMIGTGVFTTLGLQAQEIQTGFALLCLWGVGGLIAMTGALSYAYSGWNAATYGAGEVRHPQRALPAALFHGTLLTVAGVFVLRSTAPNLPRPYRVWGYPFTPAVFVLLNLVILVFVLQARPVAACASLLTVLAGVLLALLHKRRTSPNKGQKP